MVALFFSKCTPWSRTVCMAKSYVLIYVISDSVSVIILLLTYVSSFEMLGTQNKLLQKLLEWQIPASTNCNVVIYIQGCNRNL